MKKILLSCYSCDPNKGSENIVGWNWVVTYLKFHKNIYIITDLKNKKSLEHKVKDIPNAYCIKQIIYKKTLFSDKNFFFQNLNYLIWQISAYFEIKKKYGKDYFDIVHHITWCTYRIPSFFYLFKTNFIFGPASGNENSPKILLDTLPLKYRYFEYLKKINSKLIKFYLNIIQFYRYTDKLVVSHKNNYDLIPVKYHNKVILCSSVGHLNNPKKITSYFDFNFQNIRFVYVGRLLPWKGIILFIDIFQNLKKFHSNIYFDIYGSGNFKNDIIQKIKKLKLENFIKIKGFIPNSQAKNIYLKYDFNVLTSFRDSGGISILEATRRQTPSIVLDLYGPSVLVTKENGIKLVLETDNYEEFIFKKSQELYYKLLNIKNKNNFNFYQSISQNTYLEKYLKINN